MLLCFDSFLFLEMSQKTSVMSNDLISTMQHLGILKYWKGKHFITVQEVFYYLFITHACTMVNTCNRRTIFHRGERIMVSICRV